MMWLFFERTEILTGNPDVSLPRLDVLMDIDQIPDSYGVY